MRLPAEIGTGVQTAPGCGGGDPLAGLGVATVPSRSLAASGALAVAGCTGMLVGLSTGSSPDLAQAFPVLARPATDTSIILQSFRRDASSPEPARLHIDGRSAHAFPTPLGTGYALSAPNKSAICIVVPGLGKLQNPDLRWWVSGCSTARDLLAVGGVNLVQQTADRAVFVEVLPAGATTTIDRRGRSVPVPVSDGVLVVLVHHRAVVKVRAGGHTSTFALAPGRSGTWSESPLARS